MSKTLGFYREGIRELREAGFDFASASNGYLLRGDLSNGQKSAISRALGSLESFRESSRESDEESDEFDSETPWYDNAVEDGNFDSIDWFDYDYIEEFTDEEADSYDEGDAK